MGKRRLILLIAVILAVILIAVGGFIYYINSRPPVGSQVSPSVVTADKNFGIELFKNLISKDANDSVGTNMVFSPYAVSDLFAIVNEGTTDKTATQIQNVFHFPIDKTTLRQTYSDLYSLYNQPNSDFKLNVANGMWVQKDFPILDSYKSTIENYYKGNTANLDFIDATETSRQTINKWVEDQTQGKISNLFPANSIEKSTRVVLADAIYFKGTWQTKFDGPIPNFSFDNGNGAVNVNGMDLTDNLMYADTKDAQTVRLPYKGNQVSMLIILPKDKLVTAFQNFEQTFSSSTLSDIESSLKATEVRLSMPEFGFDNDYQLNPILESMGITDAFDPASARFSLIDGKTDLYLGYVVHKAFIKVTEDGTEAAAAAGAGMQATSMISSQVTMMADHPFIYLIQDNKTGNILFMGKVVDPSK